MKYLKPNCVTEVKAVIRNLVERNFSNPNIIFRACSNPAEIELVIEDYEGMVKESLTMPPEIYFLGPLYVMDWEREGKIITVVNFYLWFGDKISDLCADICIEEKNGEIFCYLDDIKVP